jgi:hypothetical protein
LVDELLVGLFHFTEFQNTQLLLVKELAVPTVTLLLEGCHGKASSPLQECSKIAARRSFLGGI